MATTKFDKPVGTEIESLNSNSSKEYTGFGQYTCLMFRLGRLRILYVFNGTDLDDGTSTKQLDAIDIPANYVSVGSFTQINANGNFGSRFLNLNTSGVLSVSGAVYRGGWTMIYISAT